jgi:signal transduction histidine kinase
MSLGHVVPGRAPSTAAGGEAPACVLVAEDNPVNRLALIRGVENQGHQVLVAENGRRALERIRSDAVDIVLLDLLMPEMDGFEVLATMQADPDLRELPVLVISALDDSASIARAIELGAIDCLPKPFDPVLLRVRLRTALAQGRLHRLQQAYLRQELALRQHEKLATLGRLSAGLAHELNNPAAAALSTAKQLERLRARSEDLLADLTGPEGTLPVDVVRSIDSRRPDRAPDIDTADEIEDVLTGYGVHESWTLAAELAAEGIQPGDVAALLGGRRSNVAGLLAWAATRLAITRKLHQLTISVERIAEIVGALRRYSYVDRAPQQDVDVRRGLDDTLTMLGHKVPDGIAVVREFAADLPTVQARGGELNQVWTNLIDNALDALNGSGRLIVRAYPDHGDVVVQVEDDGSGIPAELLGQIFEPFVTTKEPGRGTGLGLSIAHQIITEGHAGLLHVDSQPGRTVFTVRMPANADRGDRRAG